MSITTVIFDMGGVIVRTDNKEPRDRLAERLGLSREEINAVVFDSPSAQLAILGKLPVEKHWAWVCQRFHLPIEDASQLEAEFFAGDSVDYRLVDFIRNLRPRHANRCP